LLIKKEGSPKEMSQGSLQEFRSTVFYSFSSSCLTQKGVNYMQDIDPPEIEL
jgi:hypothetical protein